MLAAYGLSGAAGLIYEVAWTRLLTLRLGHSTAAASTVIAAFMGGLALGAMLAGRVASRIDPRRALRLYVCAELAVAAIALTLTWQLDAFTPVLRATYDDGRSAFWFPAARATTCFVLLLLPAAALGASFPLAARALERGSGRAGGLYAANTAGAAGFVLLPSIGLARTALAGAALTLLAAALAYAASCRMDMNPTTNDAGEASGRRPTRPLDVRGRAKAARTVSRAARRHAQGQVDSSSVQGPAWLVPSIAAATGLAGFVLEVGWTRVFALVVGPSAYAFSAILVCFIVGLATGSVFGHGLAVRLSRPVPTLVALLGIAALSSSIATTRVGTTLPQRIAADLVASAEPASSLLLRHTLWAAFILVPPVVCLGGVFPMLLGLVVRDEGSATPGVSRLYAANTLAAVLGTLAAGFVLLPRLGLERTLQAAAVVLALAAVAVFVSARVSGWLGGLAIVPALGASVAIAAGSPWDRMLIASGAYKYAHYLPHGEEAAEVLRAGTLRYYRDGSLATVAVRELTGTKSLSIDGKIDASSGGDMTTQKVLAHLPLLLHPAPARVLIVGLGSGVTAGAALKHPVEAVDVVELSTEVVEASALFAAESGSPLDDPRLRLIVGDGRSHLLLSDARYDVIVSEPSNPWMAGVAALFTREFFEAARARLAPGGLLCQWSHTYDISTEDLRSIAATFASVFPDGTMWLVGEGDLLLLGSERPVGDQVPAIVANWNRPGVADDLARGSVVAPFSLLSTFAGGPAELRAFAADAPIQRDDRMALEYTGPLAVNSPAHTATVESLLTLQERAWLEGPVGEATRAADGRAWAERGAMMLAADAFDGAYTSFDRALGLEPGRLDAARGLVRAAVGRHRVQDAERRLVDLARASRVSAPLIALSQVYFATGRVADAVAAAEAACRTQPDDIDAFAQLASVHAESGDVTALTQLVATMERRFPEAGATSYYMAALGFLRGDMRAARTAALDAVARAAHSAPAQNLLGAIHASEGNLTEARAALAVALALDPRDQAAYVNLARLETRAGNRARAKALYAEALTLDPASEAAREGVRP